MKIIDTHCDALYRLQLNRRRQPDDNDAWLNFTYSPKIETNFQRLKEGKIKLQFFAIFIDPDVPANEMWQHALEQVDLFYTEIIDKHPEMKHIKNWEELHTLKENEIGAVLALEGAEPFGNDMMKLRHLYRLGVKSIGLTWNHANLCADGSGESRGAGLTTLGEEVVQLNNQYKVLTDVSHASDQAFWDILELSKYPFASHSNTRKLCNHPRNLTDEQIKAMFAKGGFIHVVLYPPFIKPYENKATIDDVIAHIDHLCSLGGMGQIGFGSDFDGINYYVDGLEHAGKYQNLIESLLKHYTEEEVKGFAHQNFLNNMKNYFS